jgi:hypothetical protein
LITLLSVSNIDFPTNLLYILQGTKGALSMNALPISDWLKKVVKSETAEFVTEKKVVLSIVAVPFVSLLTILVYICVKSMKNSKSPYIRKIITKIDQIMLFKMILRTILAMYLQLCTVAFANWITSEPFENFQLMVSSTTLLILVFLLQIGAFMFAYFVKPEILEDPLVKKRIGTLYLGVRTRPAISVTLTGVFFTRRILFVVSLLSTTIFPVKLALLTTLVIL